MAFIIIGKRDSHSASLEADSVMSMRRHNVQENLNLPSYTEIKDLKVNLKTVDLCQDHF